MSVGDDRVVSIYRTAHSFLKRQKYSDDDSYAFAAYCVERFLKTKKPMYTHTWLVDYIRHTSGDIRRLRHQRKVIPVGHMLDIPCQHDLSDPILEEKIPKNYKGLIFRLIHFYDFQKREIAAFMGVTEQRIRQYELDVISEIRSHNVNETE